MRNFDRTGLEDLNDEASRVGATGQDAFDEPSFLEVHRAFDTYTTNEARSDSESRLMEDEVRAALEAYSEINPTAKEKLGYLDAAMTDVVPRYEMTRDLLKSFGDDIERDKAKFPDAGLISHADILSRITEKTTADREKAMRTITNARGMSKAGIVTGSATGVITDPLILGTLPLGAGTISGAGIAGNMLKAFTIEALIAGGSETLIQPSVYNWKKKIDSPYSVQEAAFNVMTAMVAAGTIRATGSAVVDVAQLRSAAKLKRAEGGKTAEMEADILEQHAENVEAAGGDVPGHFDAVDQAIDNFENGRTADTGKRSEQVEAVDPYSVQIDADQFQFKAGGDAEGVTERLQGVERWDPKLAGIAIVYENKGGQRFIVDGHQRVSLAKRMIAGGQSADEVNLNAIVLRESDGVSVADARQIAAVKNIAEGTGSVVDTAKIFRELGEAGLDLMPSLPPRSALVTAGRGLAKLDDEAFSMVVNDVVDERMGAIVGDLIQDAAEQKAVIGALAKANPANLNQARIMIQDMKAAGFQKVETMDLFGGQEVSESLFKERAQVLDNSVKRIREDKAAFKTLERKAGEIEGAGNILDREANIERITTDEKTIANLTKLANTKGPISDALNEASEKLKAGTSVKEATEGFLRAVRQSEAGERAQGAGAGAAGQSGKTVDQVEFKKGEPVSLEEVADTDKKAVEDLFISKQRGRSIEQVYKTAGRNQKQLAKAAEAITKDLGDDNATFLNPGIKKRAAAEEKLERKGYADAGKMTDIIRGGFVVRSLNDADAIREGLSKKFELMDEGWTVKDSGYFDRKLLVRFKDGSVGEIQLWEPHLLLAKENGGALKMLPEKWVDDAMEVPGPENSGHALYEKQRALEVNGKVPAEKRAEYDALSAQAVNEVYSPAIRLANREWNTLIETRRPDSIISVGEAADQAPGGLSSGMKKPERPPSGDSTTTAGRASQSTQDLTDESVNGVSISKNIAEGDKEINKKYIGEQPDAEQIAREAEIDRAIYDNDLDIPVGTRIDEDGNVVADTRGAREVYDDIDKQANTLKELEGCLFG